MILEYTRCALNNKKCTTKIKDEETFFQQAKESGLLAIIFEALDESIVPKRLYQAFYRIYLSFIQKDETQQALKEKLKNIFNEAQIDHLFMKGVHLKEMYPKSYLRGMGDIDCLIKEKDIPKSQKLLKTSGFTLDSKSDVHDVYFYHQDMVEIHQKIYHPTHRKDANILRKPWDYVIHLDNHTYRLTPEYECLHLVYHLSKHILSSGVGFRSLLDIQIFLNHTPLDKPLLKTYLKEANLEAFFNVVVAFNKRAFGLDSPFNDQPISDIDYQNIKDYLLKSGIHGKGHHFNPMAPRVFKQSKFKVLLKVMFPSYGDMKNKYKAVRYVPILLPFFYPVRWFKLLFLNRQRSQEQLKKLKTADADSTEVKQAIDTFKLGDER